MACTVTGIISGAVTFFACNKSAHDTNQHAISVVMAVIAGITTSAIAKCVTNSAKSFLFKGDHQAGDEKDKLLMESDIEEVHQLAPA